MSPPDEPASGIGTGPGPQDAPAAPAPRSRLRGAELEWSPGAPPRSARYGDVYHPAHGAFRQAAEVFLRGNQLPARWAGRERFVVLETGFGLGLNFLATWQAWRADPQRCGRLCYVAIEAHPVSPGDLERAHADCPWPEGAAALRQQWPPAVPQLHRLAWDDGAVQLLLAFGEIDAVLPSLRLLADAVYLDGFAPARNPAMWSREVFKALTARAAADATLATWCSAGAVRRDLQSAGFAVERVSVPGPKRHVSFGRRDPRVPQRVWPGWALAAPAPSPGHPAQRQALVIGAGVAGAAAALALLREGFGVTVLEAERQAASAASGNPAGLFHGGLSRDEGPHSRLMRAAAATAHRWYAGPIARGEVAGDANGLLRLDADPGGWPALQQAWEQSGLPAEVVCPLTAAEASARAGAPLAQPAWFYPQGGWISPPQWVDWALRQPGIALHTGCDAVALRPRAGGGWQALDAQGQPLAEAQTVVLACAQAAAGLWHSALQPGAAGPADPAGGAAHGAGGPWPLGLTRGQITWVATPATGPDRQPSPPDPALRLPVAGDGYALPLSPAASGPALLFGATRGWLAGGTAGPLPVTAEDRQFNLQRLQALLGWTPPPGSGLQDRTGCRLHTPDRLPIAGALPAPVPHGTERQLRRVPRLPGLFVLTALGARGLTWAPLMAELIAAQAAGNPWPLELELAEAVDPARWWVRQARKGSPAAMVAPGP